jgi:formylmethanofuran--tetrahydromethanopterin N-formyltransferase
VKIGETLVRDTYAEAFRMRYARLIVTAADCYWLEMAAREATGYAASVIGCDVEAGIESWLDPAQTPDGRPGAAILMFAPNTDTLARSVPARVGQCVMTCPTTAVFDGLPGGEERIALGKHLRFFGDGFQKSKVISGRRYWRIPVMDGEFLVEALAGVARGIGGGSLIIESGYPAAALAAARRAADAVARLAGVIAPFPGGAVRSGSKVGARYRALRASTNEAWCPTLRGQVASQLEPAAQCAYEIVIDGIDEQAIGRAMASSLRAAAGPDIIALSAANFGGHLGKFKFHLHQVLEQIPAEPA